MSVLPRLWTDLTLPVRGGDYLRHGIGLILLKFAGDTAIVMLALGRPWHPAFYLRTLGSLLTNELANAPSWLFVALAAWTLPFLWLGVSLTLRRALDAGYSPWWCVLFFVPLVNYATMGFLSLAPSRPSARGPAFHQVSGVSLGRWIRAVVFGIAVGLIGVVSFTLLWRSYSATLFLGLPAAMGMTTAFVLNRKAPVSRRTTFGSVFAVFVLAAGLAVLLAIEGVICIALVFPPVLLAGMLGAAVGVMITGLGSRNLPPALTAFLALPLAAITEPAPDASMIREVRSAVIIDAPPSAVWQQVIAFAPITDAVPWWGRLGIAYPVSARIEGSGVGAVRYCEFSTGSFVEPITVWEPGHRLAFDVTSQPDPLRELSPWKQLAPPHLEGYLSSRRGEFRLVSRPDGTTRLEGSTWYTLEMSPSAYWSIVSDWLIHRIHRRVLDHVRDEAERRVGPLAATAGVP